MLDSLWGRNWAFEAATLHLGADDGVDVINRTLVLDIVSCVGESIQHSDSRGCGQVRRLSQAK